MTSTSFGLPSLSALSRGLKSSKASGLGTYHPYHSTLYHSTSSGSVSLGPGSINQRSKSAIYNANVAHLLSLQKHGSSSNLFDSAVGGVGGFFGNLAGDVKSSVEGLGQLAKIPLQHYDHPIAAAEMLGHQLKQAAVAEVNTYAPLVHGQYGKFFHGLYQHPLGPILDAAAVFSGGATLAGKAGRLGEAAGLSGGLTSKLAALNTPKVVQVAKGVTDTLSSSPSIRIRQAGWLAAQKQLARVHVGRFHGTNTPIVGLSRRVARINASEIQRGAAEIRNTRAGYLRAISKIKKTPHLKVAWDSAVRGLHPAEEAKMLQKLDLENRVARGKPPIRDQALSLLKDPRVGHIYNEVEGLTNGSLHAGQVSKDALLVHAAREAHISLAAQNAEHLKALGKFNPDAAIQRSVLHHQKLDAVMGHPERTAAEILGKMHAEGKLIPAYIPDRRAGEIPTIASQTKLNKAILFQKGERHVGHEAMTFQHENSARGVDVLQAHKMLADQAVTIPKGEKLPRGYQWIASDPAKNIKAIREAHVAGNDKAAEADWYKAMVSSKVHPTRLAIPTHIAEDFAKQNARRTGTVIRMVESATRAWKTAILGARPAFATNQVIGNEAIYHARMSGDFVNRLGVKLKNGHAVHLFNNRSAEHGAFEQFHGEHNTGLSHDIAGNLSSKNPFHQLYRVVGAHEQGIRIATMYRHAIKIPEVRRAMNAIREADRKAGKHEDKRTLFHRAYEKAIHANPAVRTEVSRVMDDVAGNYRHYNAFESHLRNLVPFYGWNRHSVRSYFRLLSDRPALADVLTHLGDQGSKQNLADFPGVPDFMKGYVKVPKSLQGSILGNAIDTHSLNPYNTASDSIQALTSLVHGKAGPHDLGIVTNQISPLVTDAIQSMTGQNLQTGAPIKTSGGVLGGTLEQLSQNLPQVKFLAHLLGTDKKSKTPQFTPTGRPKKKSVPMLGHSNISLLGNLLGIPSRQLNLKQAQAYQTRQLTKSGAVGYHYSKPHVKKKFGTGPFG